MTNNEKIVITAENLADDKEPQLEVVVKNRNTCGYIHDQASYDAFRRGAALRKGIDVAFTNGRAYPTAEDLAAGKEVAEQSFADPSDPHGLFDPAKLSRAIEEVRSTAVAGRKIDFDTSKPMGEATEFQNREDMLATLAGLFAGGPLTLGSQRKASLEHGIALKEEEMLSFGDMTNALEAIEDLVHSGTDLRTNEKFKNVLNTIPSVGNIREMVRELALRDPLVFNDVTTSLSPRTVLTRTMTHDEVNAWLANKEGDARTQIAEIMGDDTPKEQSQEVNGEVETKEGPVDIVHEAASAARRSLVQEQIDQMNSGEGLQQIIVPIPQESGTVPPAETVTDDEAEGAGEDKETQPTPEEEFNAAFTAAIESPDTLMRALMAPAETEGGAQLKRELQKLVDTYKEVRTAQQSEAIWQEVIAPELSKISREDADVMMRSLKETHEFIESAAQGCDRLRRAVFDGYRDGIMDAVNRMPVRASEIVDRLANGTYFIHKTQYEDAARRVGNVDLKAVAEHEGVKKLSTRNQEVTIEDAAELHALLLRAGGQPESTNAVRSRLLGEMPESDTWRRKLDTVQQIAQYARRIDLNGLNDTVTRHVRVALDSLDYFVNGVRRGNYDGEAINTATMQLNAIAEEFDGAQRLARLIQNMAEYA